jgi:hypothetical protein
VHSRVALFQFIYVAGWETSSILTQEGAGEAKNKMILVSAKKTIHENEG